MDNNSKKRSSSRLFTLDYWRDDGWFVGRIREVPAACSQGETLDDLIENVRDAYLMIIKESKTTLPKHPIQSKKVSLVH
jgi:predicted RNase H-like HicB family nuclease